MSCSGGGGSHLNVESSGGSGNSGRSRKRGGKGRAAAKEKKQTIRKSCDFCNKRKKGCDGDGVNRCSYCIKKNNPDCVYSPRRPQSSRRKGTATRPPTPGSAERTGAGAYSTAIVNNAAGAQGTLKRGRFGASLATGLVGMQESAFLGDFFGCMGFLPLTCQSTVREAMVKLFLARTMANQTQQAQQTQQTQPSPFFGSNNDAGTGSYGEMSTTIITTPVAREGYGYGGASATFIVPTGAAVGTARPVAGGGGSAQQGKASDPCICTFWCAVALGGLTQGRPIRSMAPYIRLAENALAGDVRGKESAVARAWALMAYLYGFCGDSENFRACQRFAERYFLESANDAEEDAADRAEFQLLIQHADGLDLFYSDGSVTMAHVQAYIEKCNPHPQLSAAATKDDMCHFVMESYHSFGQAFFSDVVGTRGPRTATSGGSTAMARQGQSQAQAQAQAQGAPAALMDAVGARISVDHPRSDLQSLLCDDDDDDDDDNADDDMFSGAKGGGGSSGSMGGLAPAPAGSLFAGDLELYRFGGGGGVGGGFDVMARTKGDRATSSHGNQASSHVSSAGGTGAYTYGTGSYGGSGGGGGWSMQRQVEERSAFVICGDEAMDPPAHASTHMQRMMEQAAPEYERLQRAVDGPGVRGGIGGLMINCTSVVLKAAKGDIPGTVEKIGCCVDVLEQYPGLMRFPMGLHMSHLLITILASVEGQVLYNRLMKAYNPMRPAGSEAFPPFEEWYGIADICSHVYCRAIDARFSKKERQRRQQQQQQQVPPRKPAPADCPATHSGSHAQLNGMPARTISIQAGGGAAAAAAAAAYTRSCYEFKKADGGLYAGGYEFTKADGGVFGCGGDEAQVAPQVDSMVGAAAVAGGPGGGIDGRQDEYRKHQHQSSGLGAAAVWPQGPAFAPPPPTPGDEVASCAGDNDGATMCQDMDPLVTPSYVGYHSIPTEAFVPGNVGGVGGGCSRTTSGSSGGGGGNLSRENVVELISGGSNSLSELEAALYGDDDDDDDDDDQHHQHHQQRLHSDEEGDVDGADAVNLPEIAGLSTFMLSDFGPISGSDQETALAAAAAAAATCRNDTEEAVATASFLETTYAMLGQDNRVRHHHHRERGMVG